MQQCINSNFMFKQGLKNKAQDNNIAQLAVWTQSDNLHR